MPRVLKNSVVVSFVIGVFKLFYTSYKNSKLSIVVSNISLMWTKSETYECIINYIDKKPWFLNSVVNSIIRFIVKAIDKVMDSLHTVFAKVLDNSGLVAEIKIVAKEDRKTLLTFAAGGIMSICIGFATGKLLGGGISPKDLASVWLVFTISAVLLFSANYQNIIKNSLLYRFFKWLVKM